MIAVQSSAGWHSFIQLVGVLLIFVFVLILTAVVTKWVGGYQKNQLGNKNIHIIETIRITNTKYIQMLQVGEVYLIVSVCKDQVQLLAKLTKEEVPEILAEETSLNGMSNMESFQVILEKIKNSRRKK